MADQPVDLSKVMRLLYAAQRAATGPAGKVAVRYVYFDLRDEARTALPEELHGEFDALFPSSGSGKPVDVERLAALAGYLEGIVQHATLERRITAEAEAYARERVKAELRIGFVPRDERA